LNFAGHNGCHNWEAANAGFAITDNKCVANFNIHVVVVLNDVQMYTLIRYRKTFQQYFFKKNQTLTFVHKKSAQHCCQTL